MPSLVTNETELEKLLVGRSTAMAEARRFVTSVANVRTTCLIVGPRGAGKRTVARAIHHESRANGPLFTVHCAMGNWAAFDREMKAAGTIVFDGVCEMSHDAQAQFLTWVKAWSGARIVLTSHRPLSEEFRRTLDAKTLEMSALRDRREDITSLVEHFRREACAEAGWNVRIPSELMETFSAYAYPGNARELRNVVERLVVHAADSGTAEARWLPAEMQTSADGSRKLDDIVSELESRLVSEAMKATKDNQVQAAEKLGLTRSTLQYKLKKYGYVSQKKAA